MMPSAILAVPTALKSKGYRASAPLLKPVLTPAVLLGTQTQSFAGTDLRMLLSVGDGFIAAAVSAGANVRV